MDDEEINQYTIDQMFPDFVLSDLGLDVKEIMKELLTLMDNHGLQSPEVKEFMKYHFDDKKERN